jgi:hypothetical protein
MSKVIDLEEQNCDLKDTPRPAGVSSRQASRTRRSGQRVTLTIHGYSAHPRFLDSLPSNQRNLRAGSCDRRPTRWGQLVTTS